MKSELKRILVSIIIMLFSFAAFSGVDEGKKAFSAGNYKKAVDEFRISAEQGNSEAQLMLGLMYGHFWQKDEKESAKWIKKAAEQGQPDAQNALAMLYGTGTGVHQDSEEAAKWYRKAAEQGHIHAQRMLGLWLTSVITPHDYTESFFWLKKAAEQGDAEAQYNLGQMYINGQGVTQNYIQAHMWLNIVGATGHSDAIKLRELVAKDMTSSQLQEAQKLASEWMVNHKQ